jgi:glutathione synthase/RimK-type ligase-like ATP-grasp enzyme
LDVQATLVDLARFPQELGLAIRYDEGGRAYRLLDRNEELDLGSYRVVWWRRPRPFVLHRDVAEGEYHSFAYNESLEAFAGLWQALDAAWINHPTREQVAARKVYQLRVAQDVGLEIPTTLVTNDPSEAKRFVESHRRGGVAYKTFLPAAHDWRETRILGSQELDQIESVSYAPVIFQEYVPVELDLRITVVGETVLATAIHSRDTHYEADYRMDLDNARVEAFDLPGEVRKRVADLAARLGLVYGAVDMRLTPDGRFVFLEVNPSGEWLFVEERSEQPITETFAHLLAGYVTRRPAATAGARPQPTTRDTGLVASPPGRRCGRTSPAPGTFW